MKKFLAFGLLALLSALSCMLPIRYGMKQAAKVVLRWQMREAGHAATNVFSAGDLSKANWENDHEFRLNGILYDVAAVKLVNGVKQYHCINDELELRVEHVSDEAALAMLHHAPGKPSDDHAKAVFDWLQSLYFQSAGNLLEFRDFRFGERFFTANADAYQYAFLKFQIIPPEA